MNVYDHPSAKLQIGSQLLAQSKFYSDYSRWQINKNTFETWNESVRRVMNMHRDQYFESMSDELTDLINFAENSYIRKEVLGAQRALQYGGDQILKHEGRLYNCSASWCDRTEFFQQAMYMLLCGCGVGFSVQKSHVNKLPPLVQRRNDSLVYVVPDSIEGWSNAFGVLISSFLDKADEVTFPEFIGKRPIFDLSKIRPKGAEISGGFKAPGPEPLRKALQLVEDLLERERMKGETRIRPIIAYDITMYMADAVISGGVRRSATICLFDKDDEEMLKAKTGNWFYENPQRGRSNNSVILERESLDRTEWSHIIKNVRDYGEPGFVFTDNLDFVFNPCVEIGMLPVTSTGKSGFQMCNLTEINGGKCTDKERFYDACKAAAVLGTLQAGYTHFPYLGKATEEIVCKEALLGVSITGWMNNPNVLFDPDVLMQGAKIVRETNAKVAKLIGINPAARTTCVKPSGNASVLLGTASGIHGEHAPNYFRNVQLNRDNHVADLIEEVNPVLIESSVWNSEGTDIVMSFPVVAPNGSIFKKDLLGTKQLEYVKIAQMYWVEAGTNHDLCQHPNLRHNVSNTIQVDDWEEIEEYLYENRYYFAGVSLLDVIGDKAYAQAPFTEVYSSQELIDQYKDAALFASGLIVDGLYAFNDNLWEACDTVLGKGKTIHPSHSHDLLKRDWVRRANKFATNYFNNNIERMIECLKDVYNLHKWNTVIRQLSTVDFQNQLNEKSFVDVGSMGAQACSGNACEITF